MKKTTFLENGQFYKGSIHCHTTCSDGKLSPDAIVKAYQDKGYDFLAITDHNVFSHYTCYDTDRFVMIQGVEGNLRAPADNHREYHFIVLPGPDGHWEAADGEKFAHGERLEIPMLSDKASVQAYIDDLYRRGYMVMINHPFWSRIEYDEILGLINLFAVEIFNYCSQILENMGESNVCYDALLRNGMKLWCTAVDDNHNDFPLDSAKCDSFGGFVQVKAEELSERAICNALASGSFYASMGPEIHDFYIEDGRFYFKCSPVQKIYANGDVRQIHCAVAEDAEHPLTEMSGELRGNEKYLRIECYDFEGRKAWTNPIWLI